MEEVNIIKVKDPRELPLLLEGKPASMRAFVRYEVTLTILKRMMERVPPEICDLVLIHVLDWLLKVQKSVNEEVERRGL